MNKKQK